MNHWLCAECRKAAQTELEKYIDPDDPLQGIIIKRYIYDMRNTRHNWRRLPWLCLGSITSLSFRWRMRGWIRPVKGGVYADVLVDDDPLYVPIPSDVSRSIRSYWIAVYLFGLMRTRL